MDFPELSQELDDAFARGTPERCAEIIKRINVRHRCSQVFG